ncbi:lmo0937 family membrane protein [Dehalogenimonas sp. THU2]
MLLTIAIILVILWALGLFAFSLGALVNIALALALILIIVWLIKKIGRV